MYKNNIEIYERITALVDNELPEDEIRELRNIISTDLDLQFEYKIQADVKKLLQKRFATHTAPAYLYDNVMNRITARNESVESENRSKNNFLNIIKLVLQPKYVFAALVIFASVLFLSTPFNNVDPDELAFQQHGRYNFWVQANSNFENIIEGKLTAQFASNDPEKIQKFFEESGVKYSAEIQICENWDLAGGVVTKDKGEIFAHHVYADAGGHILYVYQVDEKYVGKSAVLNLSDDMLSYIKTKKVFKHSFLNYTSYLVSSHDKFFAIVSNAKPGKIESDFISQIL